MSHEPNKKVRDALWAWANVAYVIRRKEREIQGYAERVSDALAVQVSLKSSWSNFMPGSPIASGSTTEWAIERAEEREEQYKAEIARLQGDIDRAMGFKRAVDEAIESLSSEEQRVIEMRYLKKHPWQFIGTMEGRTERWARITEVEAIKKLFALPLFSVWMA